MYFPVQTKQMGKLDPCIDCNADPRHILGDDRRFRSAGDAAVQHCHKEQIQYDIQPCGNRQKDERHHGIPQGAQERSEKVIKEDPGQSGEYHDQIIPHQSGQLIRRAQKPDDPVDACKDENIQHNRHDSEKNEGRQDPFFERGFVLLAEPDGEYGSASHGKPQ